ncbi:MAG: hypothetical protein LC720_06335 [Actinobacteria bacterium]|nr:hypothetical protein [Actinomycetota bacterium]
MEARAYVVGVCGPGVSAGVVERAQAEVARAGEGRGPGSPEAVASVREALRDVALGEAERVATGLGRRLRRLAHRRVGCAKVPGMLRDRAAGRLSARDVHVLYHQLDHCHECAQLTGRLDAAEWHLHYALTRPVDALEPRIAGPPPRPRQAPPPAATPAAPPAPVGQPVPTGAAAPPVPVGATAPPDPGAAAPPVPGGATARPDPQATPVAGPDREAPPSIPPDRRPPADRHAPPVGPPNGRAADPSDLPGRSKKRSRPDRAQPPPTEGEALNGHGRVEADDRAPPTDRAADHPETRGGSGADLDPRARTRRERSGPTGSRAGQSPRTPTGGDRRGQTTAVPPIPGPADRRTSIRRRRRRRRAGAAVVLVIGILAAIELVVSGRDQSPVIAPISRHALPRIPINPPGSTRAATSSSGSQTGSTGSPAGTTAQTTQVGASPRAGATALYPAGASALPAAAGPIDPRAIVIGLAPPASAAPPG